MFRILGRVGKIEHDIEETKKYHYDFKFKEGGKIVPIVADETVEFKQGDAKSIKIKEIKIPPKHLVLICSYARHRVGHVIAMGEEFPVPVEMERSADRAMFIAGIDGTVSKDDLIGMALLIPIETM
ncbi:DUF22 domain-containing protein [Methanotorris igneus]|uniref:DUF22 domain-containing protein n=1 Tax=Methanotorris igneus (strain DSM 5666 / JCM 11834 / Kol 5) TaxID=880724 RepID=F6BCH0_METIK|nr:DUF22 domain-containing protein [Methanotorris igneus]AEF96181.1 protein of unknown function DUF22 [Methanotorris igneus Kol 5]